MLVELLKLSLGPKGLLRRRRRRHECVKGSSMEGRFAVWLNSHSSRFWARHSSSIDSSWYTKKSAEPPATTLIFFKELNDPLICCNPSADSFSSARSWTCPACCLTTARTSWCGDSQMERERGRPWARPIQFSKSLANLGDRIGDSTWMVSHKAGVASAILLPDQHILRKTMDATAASGSGQVGRHRMRISDEISSGSRAIGSFSPSEVQL